MNGFLGCVFPNAISFQSMCMSVFLGCMYVCVNWHEEFAGYVSGGWCVCIYSQVVCVQCMDFFQGVCACVT